MGKPPGGGQTVDITFWGVRGSTPCSCAANQRYGGNTSCVTVEHPGHEPIILDLGTGLRFFGETQPADGTFVGHAFVSHLHWDHVQGLPFFVPANRAGARLTVHGPASEDGRGLGEAFDDFMRPPYFPVRVQDLAGDITFDTLEEGVHAVGDAKVTAVMVPHIGVTFGYRIELGGHSVAYLPDHQQPLDGSLAVPPEVVALCRDVDVLIHDAQYTPTEFADKAHWGHCTLEFALAVAAEAGARRLVLFHHDPAHDDETMDALLAELRAHPLAAGLEEILAASEGLTLSLAPSGVA